METASFGSRGCILQGKVALCPDTPCIDSMGTVTHSWRGVVEKFFFFFFPRYRAEELWRRWRGDYDYFEKKEGKRMESN